MAACAASVTPMSSPDDYADLRPEPMPAETCVWKGQVYRRHEAWDGWPTCSRCGKGVDPDADSHR